MVTLFAIPKPFTGHFGIIQRNAIKSWTLLTPKPQIILFGNEIGTEQVARDFGCLHIPDVKTNEYGTPLLSSVFDSAQTTARYSLRCYINSDIILLSDFSDALRRISHIKKFLLTGQRWNIEINSELDFGEPDWEKSLRSRVLKHGQAYGELGMDYFAFPKNLPVHMPPFVVGRIAWDNWFIYSVRKRRAKVIDATSTILATHQNHDYSHIPVQTNGDAWTNIEARNNQKIMKDDRHLFTLTDATHHLAPSGLKLNINRKNIARHLHTLSILQPRLRFLRNNAFFLYQTFIKGQRFE